MDNNDELDKIKQENQRLNKNLQKAKRKRSEFRIIYLLMN